MKSPETKQRKLSPLRLSVSNNQVLNFIILGLTGLFFFFNILVMYFIFACTESLLISAGFLHNLQLWGVGAILHCGAWASPCSGFSFCGALVLDKQAQQLWPGGSRAQTAGVVVPGVSRSTACGVFPDQGSNLCPLHWQAVCYLLYHQGSPLLTLDDRN